MKNIVRTGLITLVGIGMCVGFVLFALYPHRPKDILGWVVLTLVAVPVVLGLELLGTGLLENRLVARMGRLTRIMYGVGAILAICILLILVWTWLQPHLGTW
jgi:hypothetical protein